jgi:hypothetical protein
MRTDERLSIGQLSLRLPAGFAQRAPGIARLTAHALAAQSIGGSAHLGQLHMPPLRVNARRSDRAIAHQLATAIAHHITQATATAQG